MNLAERVQKLIDQMNNGQILEAFEEHYADDVVMQENANPGVEGKAANREREKAFLGSVKAWNSLNVSASAVSGDDSQGVSFIEYDFDFINTEDQPVSYEQVAVQRWRDGRIVHERFYYNAGA